MNPTQIAQLKVLLAQFRITNADVDNKVLIAYLDGALAGILGPTAFGASLGNASAAPTQAPTPTK